MKATESAMSTFHIEWEKNIIYYTILYDYKIWKEKFCNNQSLNMNSNNHTNVPKSRLF